MQIPGYKIESLIAKGGMSSVYLAMQESLGRPVALKLLEKFDNQSHATRFLHEARTIAQLEHRNIITIHDIGSIGERHFIAMEYLQGGSLSDRISGGMPLERILSLLEKMAICLHFVHKRGIIHRDIKPSNILFHADGTPKLTDFGIAKMLDINQELTMEGNTLGSPYYLSPEQAQGNPLDGRSDIYSLGIIFYEMLTGEKPFARETPIETVVAHLSDPLPLLPHPFAAYQPLLEKMIAKDPAERVENAKRLALLIRESRRADTRLREASPLALRHPAHPPHNEVETIEATYTHVPSRPSRLPLAVGAGLLLAAGAWFVLDTGDASRQVTEAPSVAAGHAPPEMRVPQRQAAALTSSATPALKPDPVSPATPPPPVATAAFTAAQSLPTSTPSVTPGATSPDAPLPPDPGPAADTVQAAADQLQPPAHRIAIDDPADNAAQIAALLQAAERAVHNYRLTTPPGDNAHRHYQAVLAIDPDNRAAQRGIETIAARYAALARRAMRNNNYRLARIYRARGNQVLPRHDDLAALRDEITRREAAHRAPRAQLHAPATDALADQQVDQPAGTSLEELRGREGTGNIIRDVGTVLRAIFN